MTDLEKRVNTLESVLGTLIAWTASTSGSPISVKEAEELLKWLKTKELPSRERMRKV